MGLQGKIEIRKTENSFLINFTVIFPKKWELSKTKKIISNRSMSFSMKYIQLLHDMIIKIKSGFIVFIIIFIWTYNKKLFSFF